MENAKLKQLFSEIVLYGDSRAAEGLWTGRLQCEKGMAQVNEDRRVEAHSQSAIHMSRVKALMEEMARHPPTPDYTVQEFNDDDRDGYDHLW